MKTPQEQAEEIVNQTIFAIDQYYQNYADYRIEMKLEIKQKIPLPELIAVARAARDLNETYQSELGALVWGGKTEL